LFLLPNVSISSVGCFCLWEYMKIQFTAQIKKYSKIQLVSLDSEYEIILRTNDVGNVSILDKLSKADETVDVTISRGK